VAVGFADVPDPLTGIEDGGAQPPPFSEDASRPDTGPPSPGCADKGCGEFCKPPCEGDAASCPPPSVFHVCSSTGRCLPEQPGCAVIQNLDAGEKPSYVPCAGIACGTGCVSCMPGSSGCTSPSLGVCHADGSCGPFPAGCQ
jgi:hypothetical protein